MSALKKGIQIIQAVSSASAGLTFSEIVSQTGLPKASTHRTLRELVELTALTYDDSTRRYRGGLLLASLGASVTENYDVRRVVRPHLETLQHNTRNVATLGIRDGDEGVYVDKIEPENFVIRLHSDIGKRFPLHCTGLGKVLLAHSDAATITKVARRKLRRYTDNTITDSKNLRKELESVIDNGYAVDREEITRGLTCVAAPVYGISGDVEAAVSCTMSSFDATEEQVTTIARHVVACAEAASR